MSKVKTVDGFWLTDKAFGDTERFCNPFVFDEMFELLMEDGLESAGMTSANCLPAFYGLYGESTVECVVFPVRPEEGACWTVRVWLHPSDMWTVERVKPTGVVAGVVSDVEGFDLLPVMLTASKWDRLEFGAHKGVSNY